MIDQALNFVDGKIEKEPDVYEEQTYHNVNQICDRLVKESDSLIEDLDEMALRKFANKDTIEPENVD